MMTRKKHLVLLLSITLSALFQFPSQPVAQPVPCSIDGQCAGSGDEDPPPPGGGGSGGGECGDSKDDFSCSGVCIGAVNACCSACFEQLPDGSIRHYCETCSIT